jgi:hypothetical protein
MKKIRAAIALTMLFPYVAFAGSPPVKPSRTEPDTERPLRWLMAAQGPDGGWGSEAKAVADVATTAISGIALIRMGNTMSAGTNSKATRHAVEYVVRAVERTPAAELAINPPGTLPQRKLGRYIDTFLAAQFLAEAIQSMPKGREKDRVLAALDGCVDRIQAAQRKDGSFSPDGWAPVLSSAFAEDGLYAARDAGAKKVRSEVLSKANAYMMENYDTQTKQFKTSEAAGVPLYAVSGTVDAAARAGAMDGPAAKAALARLSDESFLRGFGTYGGEEHVSYMMTSVALAAVGGKEFERWDKGIRMRLANIQREDGTWRGDHCITSTAFCTAASLITLTIHAAAKPSAKPRS